MSEPLRERGLDWNVLVGKTIQRVDADVTFPKANDEEWGGCANEVRLFCDGVTFRLVPGGDDRGVYIELELL